MIWDKFQFRWLSMQHQWWKKIQKYLYDRAIYFDTSDTLKTEKLLQWKGHDVKYKWPVNFPVDSSKNCIKMRTLFFFQSFVTLSYSAIIEGQIIPEKLLRYQNVTGICDEAVLEIHRNSLQGMSSLLNFICLSHHKSFLRKLW